MHDVSGGNPFFALEVARALQRRSMRSSHSEPLPVPPTLLELVRERLDALPGETRDALQIVASLSQPTLGLVAAAAPDATPAEELQARLRRACDAGRYRFEAGDTAGARRLLQDAMRAAVPGQARAAIVAILGRVHLYEGDELLAADLFRRVLEEADDNLARRRAP